MTLAQPTFQQPMGNAMLGLDDQCIVEIKSLLGSIINSIRQEGGGVKGFIASQTQVLLSAEGHDQLLNSIIKAMTTGEFKSIISISLSNQIGSIDPLAMRLIFDSTISLLHQIGFTTISSTLSVIISSMTTINEQYATASNIKSVFVAINDSIANCINRQSMIMAQPIMVY